MTLAPNSCFGSYIITSLLGAGFNGEVYRCQDPVHGRDVALKILQPENGSEDRTTVEQFQQEALIMDSLRHPNIVEFYDSGVEDGVPYVVSEFLDGKQLRGPIEGPELAMIAAQIAAGITGLHIAGIAHNDVKPGNLIITADGLVKIIDFGIARKLTPEIAEDPHQLTEWLRCIRGDQLSLGLTLYELATGRVPFKDKEALHTLSELLGNHLLPLPPESQSSIQDALRRCAAVDGSYAGLLLTAMSVALSLAGAPILNSKP
ncbi:MAG: eukaryotic-like serine/threonine-protein kinase [Blastocatellia bacterium]|nr:eukaryotic-like serine/threonine-protein kinase [Blastocatellia bacterium]